MKIICTHLYNDYSGSPLVLANAIKSFQKQGKEVEIVTSTSEGFLSNLNIAKKEISYTFQSNKWMRLIYFLWNQCRLFFYVFSQRHTTATIYVNTLLPFGAALAGKLTRKKVIYHIHETSIQPALLKGFLKYMASITATQTIYVSKYLQKTEPIGEVPQHVIYNALSPTFIEQAEDYLKKAKKAKNPFTVLMLCSLKKYKGVDEFVQLAAAIPQYQFELVVNANKKEIANYFNNQYIPANLTIFDRQSNVHPFYQRASLVLNLSDPNRWIETFGMTLLEAMHYGIPVIAPSVGGPTEVVVDGRNGYTINGQETEKLTTIINNLATKPKLYQQFVDAALHHTKMFSSLNFELSLSRVIN